MLPHNLKMAYCFCKIISVRIYEIRGTAVTMDPMFMAPVVKVFLAVMTSLGIHVMKCST